MPSPAFHIRSRHQSTASKCGVTTRFVKAHRAECRDTIAYIRECGWNETRRDMWARAWRAYRLAVREYHSVREAA